MSGSSLAVKAAALLVVVALIGKYTDEHPTTGHTNPPATAAAAPAVGSAAVRAQEHLVFGSGSGYQCAAQIISHESSGDPHAVNPDGGAYGLPQALPGDKMASAGPDWRDNPTTQLRWMHTYVDERYGGPCPAWAWWQAHHWY